ncbi:MAG: zinc ribbon domain-containing protein, partial [Bacteroidales bacterium]|nr:zinc ribbon domain-containing protein [Bacteroidales bacterium]
MSRRRAKADAPTGSNPVFELTDMAIDFVSLVPAGANRQRKWLVRKADGTPAGMTPGDPGAPSEQSTEEQTPSPTDRPAFCPYCGAALPVGCLNCPGCDRPVPDLLDPTLPEPPKPVVPPTPEGTEAPEEPEEPEAPKPEPPKAPAETPPEGSSSPPAKPAPEAPTPPKPEDEQPKPGEPKPEDEAPKPDEEELGAVPDAEAPDEEKRAAQEARAKEYEIEALGGTDAALSWPADAPTKLDLYGDPVNLKYPLGGTSNEADP